jgi:hypothetical protein
MKDRIEELTKAYREAGADWIAAKKERAELVNYSRLPMHAYTALDLRAAEGRDREWTTAAELRPLLMAAEVEAGDVDAIACDPARILAEATVIAADEARAREVLKGISQRRADLSAAAQAAHGRLAKRRLADGLPQPPAPPPLDDMAKLQAFASPAPATESPHANAVKTARWNHTQALAAAERRAREEEAEKEESERRSAAALKNFRQAEAENKARIAEEQAARLAEREEAERLAAAFAARKGESA